jgi:hypothetical protein
VGRDTWAKVHHVRKASSHSYNIHDLPHSGWIPTLSTSFSPTMWGSWRLSRDSFSHTLGYAWSKFKLLSFNFFFLNQDLPMPTLTWNMEDVRPAWFMSTW